MKREEIYLHVEREGDRFIVVDQDGREVKYVRSVNVNSHVDDVCTVSIEFYDSSIDSSNLHQ